MTRIPSPADVAARGRTTLTARPGTSVPPKSVAAPSLPDTAPFRMRYETGIRHSAMPKNARLVALTIATWADYDTGLIPENRHPGVPVLVRATGLVEGAVREALYLLKDRGWIRRQGDPGGHRAAPITLTIPAAR